MAMPTIPPADLDEIFAATESLWQEMRGERLFLSGGTGFFGCWLVESFLHINRRLSLGSQLTVLTRNPGAFLEKMPHLRGAEGLHLLEGDVRTFEFPSGTYRFAIHAATEASARQMAEEPDEMRSTIVAGTARMLAFAASAETRKLLFTSSGAIYGPQTMAHMTEDHPPVPDTVYGIGKLAAEKLCAEAATAGLEIKIARCYAFQGPHLPLEAHFAAGNFLADALAGRTIRIASNGSAVRSYLYASDLAICLWTMLFRAPSLRPYNVGSEYPVTIRELAETTVLNVDPMVHVQVAQAADPSRPPHRYVPATLRAQQELGLHQTVSLAEGLRRTAAWHRLK